MFNILNIFIQWVTKQKQKNQQHKENKQNMTIFHRNIWQQWWTSSIGIADLFLPYITK